MTTEIVKIKLKSQIFWTHQTMDLENLAQLEARINQLLEKHEKIKKEKELTEKRLQQKESEWHQLKGQIRQYERERSEMRDKVEKILGHIENLEIP